ncbi:CsbD-like [Quadrisphaera granulorum]|uniref:CsbD-like protein n=1 Tax=Quadrisphaera granulorum TaxID=317664 RepID=A0A316AAF5_9ACTN|nr:CsbD family protein [Quadrisphaera granulorum]PWJ53844.1 CsbD-like protein [Quadrisphaera granulorum]SZE96601.1 CsbD-like [Quadrisphaera granulorum]
MSAIDKVKNAAQEAAGKVKEAVGEKSGNRDLQAEGQRDQVAGDLKQRGEHVKDAFTR